MSKKILSKGKKDFVPGSIYVVRDDKRNGENEVLKAGSPVQLLWLLNRQNAVLKDYRTAVVKDYRGIQWELEPRDLTKEAIQKMPTRGRIWLARAKPHLYSFFDTVDELSLFLKIVLLFLCFSLFALWVGSTEKVWNIPPQLLRVYTNIYYFVMLFIGLLTGTADPISCYLLPYGEDKLFKEENLRKLKVLLKAQKADAEKEQKL